MKLKQSNSYRHLGMAKTFIRENPNWEALLHSNTLVGPTGEKFLFGIKVEDIMEAMKEPDPYALTEAEIRQVGGGTVIEYNGEDFGWESTIGETPNRVVVATIGDGKKRVHFKPESGVNITISELYYMLKVLRGLEKEHRDLETSEE